jgi:MerT mercuric transport protein
MANDRDNVSTGQAGRVAVGAAVGTATAGVGAAVTATIASVCCTGPVLAPIIVGLLGATGAAAAAGLKPYTPYLFALSLVMLAVGFRSVYRARRVCVVAGSTSSPGVALNISQTVLWLAAALWVASVIFTLYPQTTR